LVGHSFAMGGDSSHDGSDLGREEWLA
jgi:hypothetical protein